MSLIREFVMLATQENANISQLARRYAISRKTAYKWIRRFQDLGPDGLAERSRRPHRSPTKTPTDLEEAVLAIRRSHPAWGPRKIRRYLLDRIEAGELALEAEALPAVSTCAAILKRNNMLAEHEPGQHQAWQRFERAQPNELWQMDFKGHFALFNQARCYPLTVLDDHSRFALGLYACPDERHETVKGHLATVFRRYGLPAALLCDNGNPWGTPMQAPTGERYWTAFEVWLLRLGIDVLHGRAHHPQTQGKQERFHRTLKAEVLRYESFRDHRQCQHRFDQWRRVYNLERPHEALDLAVPARRYRVSGRVYPEQLPPIEYGPGDQVRKVQSGGVIHFRGRVFKVGGAFRGYPVAVRATGEAGQWAVYFCHKRIKFLDERVGKSA